MSVIEFMKSPDDPREPGFAIGDVLLFLSIPLIGLLDYLGGNQIRLTAIFLIPVILITWRYGAAFGYATALFILLFLLSLAEFGAPIGMHWKIFLADSGGRVVAFLLIVTFISRLRDAYLRQRTLATRDPLTGLYNRLGFREILAVELERSRRDGNAFSMLFLDCDNFKQVNDRRGHHAGDELLRTVGKTLYAHVRKSDVVCRLGGDEFVVYLAHVGEIETRRLAVQLKSHLDAAMQARGFPVTFSIGASVFESLPDSVEQAVGFADALMYRSKKQGKNTISVDFFRETPRPPPMSGRVPRTI